MTTNPQQIELFILSKNIVIRCYELTMDLNEDEKTNFSRYIRKASLDLHINIAQAAFAKPKKRNKMIDAAINSLIIIETAADILSEVGLVNNENVNDLLNLTSRCEKLTREIYLIDKFPDKS